MKTFYWFLILCFVLVSGYFLLVGKASAQSVDSLTTDVIKPVDVIKLNNQPKFDYLDTSSRKTKNNKITMYSVITQNKSYFIDSYEFNSVGTCILTDTKLIICGSFLIKVN